MYNDGDDVDQNIPNKYLPWNIKRKRIWLAWFILLIGLVVTWSISVYVKNKIDQRAKQEFDFVANEIKNKIVTRLFAHAQILRSGSAFIEGSKNVTREEWRTFIEHQQINNNLPGIQGIGYSIIIRPDQLKQHEEKIRKERFSRYAVTPPGQREIYTSIIYLEPFSGRNLRAFGYDMFSDSTRRKAMEYARDYDVATLSGKVTLVQETAEDVQVGTLMYVPVFDKSQEYTTADERRRAIRGWVYSPYRMNDLMKEILGGYGSDEQKHFHIKIFDDPSFAPKDLLYDSRTDTTASSKIFSAQTSILFNNHTWYLQITQEDNTDLRIGSSEVWGIAIVGTLISVLLCILYLVLINTNHRAFALAEQVLKDLRATEEQFKSIFDMHDTVMLLIEPESGNIVDANAAAVRFYGYTKAALCSMNIAAINVSDEQEISALRKKSLNKNQNYFIFRHKLANGEVRSVEVHSSSLVHQEKNLLFSIIHDITDRIQAEELLQQTHQNYETFFNTIDDFLFVLDEAGNIIHVNSCVTDRLGYTEDELINVSVLMVHSAERRDEAGRIVAEMLAGKVEFCPVPLITKAGIQIPVETRVKHGIWNNRPVIFGVTKDISRLTLSEEKFSKLFYLNPSACGLSDLETYQYLEVNDQFSALLGFEKGEVVGKTALELGILTEDERSSLAQTADNNGRVSNVVTSLRAKNGELKRVLISAENIYVQNKKYRFTIVHDITDLKKMEDRLQESEERWNFALEGSGDGVWDWNAQTNQVFFSHQWKAMLGYSDNEIGTTLDEWSKRLHPDDEQQVFADLNKHFQKETPVYQNEHRVLCKNGTYKWVLDRGKVIQWTSEGKPLRVIGTHSDIARRKQTEEALRQAQKLEGIGTLAGGIAHDFNNLLVGILGQSELALKKLPKESPAISNIVKMITASERAADLTKQLLAYSGKGKFFTIEVDLNKLVQDNGQLLEVSVPKNAQLRYDLISFPLRIMGDVGQIQQVIMNLIINAGEAIGSDQGFISLRTRIISLAHNDTKYDKYTNTSLVEGSYALLEVSDTGCGISDESLSRIFDPFFTTKFTGRGLGLAAVLGIIRGHKGGLRIESKLGKGTMFEVILPLIENGAAFENDTTKAIHSGNNKTKTILVIDDDPTVIGLLHDTLTDEEYNIISSDKPLEGIELYRKHQQDINLVILDYSMPVMDGKAVFEELLKINSGVKVVLSSGYTEEAALSTFGTVRPIGFFQKPYKIQTIIERISQIVNV